MLQTQTQETNMNSAACKVRPAVEAFEPYAPGRSIGEIRELYALDSVIKLASNENPLGASPLAQKAIQRAAGEVFRYAQTGAPRLARAIAARHGVDPACVVVGNGSDEIIDLLVRCKAEPGRHNVVAFKPCFSLYPLQTRLCGVELRQAPLNADFTFNWEGLCALIDANTALVFVTTPDNPSGYSPPAGELAALAQKLPPGALLVIDEAYMDFAAADKGVEGARLDEFSLLPRIFAFGNIAVLRTFSKSYGLAGLRLGYGIMPAALAGYLCRVRLPFSVNILAEAAGLAALDDLDFRRATLLAVEEGRDYLTKELAALGCRVFPSRSNFIMFAPPPQMPLGRTSCATLALGLVASPESVVSGSHPSPSQPPSLAAPSPQIPLGDGCTSANSAKALGATSERAGGFAAGASVAGEERKNVGPSDYIFEALLRRGLILRQLKNYGLPEFLRTSVGNADENRVLISTLRELLHG